MSGWKLSYNTKARKDIKKIRRAGEAVVNSFFRIIFVLQENPLKNPPPYEKLLGLNGCYSRRINVKHRLVYTFDLGKREITVVSAWGHYDDN